MDGNEMGLLDGCMTTLTAYCYVACEFSFLADPACDDCLIGLQCNERCK